MEMKPLFATTGLVMKGRQEEKDLVDISSYMLLQSKYR